MPPKSNLTADEEKKIRILNYFTSSNMVFSAATLDTVAKATKVSSMIIKNLVQSLADENLICTDKIGASTNYWQFSGTVQREIQSKNDKLRAQAEALQKEKDKLISENQKLTDQNQLNGDLGALITELKEIKSKHAKMSELQALYEKNSPDLYIKLLQCYKESLELINMETDNIFTLKRYLIQKLNMEKKQAEQLIRINGDFDYYE
ncbi:Meiotic nuclear division protein 1 [Spironucleus salmonicida]|uniref:Meiotic nuclear division protein 1 n=1 Tax=Spironucleus salmonicida TaxID=348837 RepID=V6LH58_9EUKA|nr:Meiotic nuclear division protein 1 [Spironucleus salmonicida]|eukprot:EST43872.1 Meiotic nuclear division protein 1 [Spironucleus salmonicida]